MTLDLAAIDTRVRSSIYSSTSDNFLFSERIYQKITSEQDSRWLLTTLQVTAQQASLDWSKISNPWAKTLISTKIANIDFKKVTHMDNTSDQEELCKSMVAQMTSQVWRLDQTPQGEEGLGVFLKTYLPGVLSCVDERVSTDFKDDLLIEMLIIAHHACLGSKFLWIELCQMVDRDPADIITLHFKRMFESIIYNMRWTRTELPMPNTQAALRAGSTLVFVAPAVATNSFVHQIQVDLTGRFVQLGSDSMGIWLTPEGTTYHDVLGEQKNTTVIDKNTRDWQTAEWEASVRKRIAEKKSLQRKLSKEDHLRVQAQLDLEAKIRSAIDYDISCVRRGLALIRSLNLPYIEAESWFSPVIKVLLSDIVSLSKPYLDTAVTDVYLECCVHATSAAPDARLLGLATLHIVEATSSIDEKREFVNRVLYKLRFASEQGPFTFLSLIYALPLIESVLRSSSKSQMGLTGCKTDEQLDEQIFLALEFLDRNSETFSDARIARSSTVASLVEVIKSRPSQASDARAVLQDIVTIMASNTTRDELQCICDYFCAPDMNVRNIALAAAEPLDLTDLEFSPKLWLAMYDTSEQNATLARSLFQDNAMKVNQNARITALDFLGETSDFERSCAARALAGTFEDFPDGLTELLEALITLYNEASAEEPPEYDRYGQVVIKAKLEDKTSGTRVAIGLSFIELCQISEFQDSHVITIAHFLLKSASNGRSPVADLAVEVRNSMLEAGKCMIQHHGKTTVEELLPIFESGLSMEGSSDEADWTREAAIILYGAAAANLASGDTRIATVIEQLLSTLSTPAESVQSAIAECLPSLISHATEVQAQCIHDMLSQLSDGNSYAARRGAAYGLAGIVKGCGISSLKGLQVMEALEAAITNKRSSKARQGALFAYECFAQFLDHLWEPYVESIVPLLLLTFADNDSDVRSSTQDTSRAIMSRISGFGVQSILPSLLSGLQDHQWRSKKGSVELIGAMAYCAPRQLSASLPTIIPKLNEVLTDSHAQVRAAGNDSLTRFGEVITNPEIQQLVPSLLKALSDPNKYTEDALDKLLKTSFLHYIDSPSLSMLMPILERGMQERSATTKKKSAKIFGLLASLTTPNDLIPHLSSLIPCLRTVLIDTVPDVRATAAKALGSLVEKLGERNFPDLITDFLDSLNANVSSTDRQGAAQGLAEVLAGLGLDRLEDTLPRILKDSRSVHAYVREGFISLLIYLPATFGSRFAPYLAKSISPILAGLADESEFVRDASLRAGKIMIANYATKSVDLMLPELEQGMFNDSWRIRVSSLQLVGDLLFKVSGIAVKSQTEDDEEDEAVATEAQRNALLQALGQVRRDRIFSSLYIARFDSFAMVRSSAINVWKALVANTPKTLRDILPTLIEVIISNLAIEDSEKRAIFVETLGDMMRKMGRDLLTLLLPAFEEGLRSTDADRVGVCVAITEVLQSASSDQIEELEDRLVSAIKVVLIDHNPQVRAAANETFDSLQTQFGPRVIDKVLPDLLLLLQSEDKAEEALEALKGLMQVRSHVILPILLPGLLQRPMSGFNLQAIGSLVRVAGPALTRRLPILLSTIMDAEIRNEAQDDASKTFETVLLSTTDSADSVASIMNIMMDFVKNDDHRIRVCACLHLGTFFARSRLDFSRYVSDWVRILITLFADSSSEVVEASWQAQDALVKSLKKEELAQLVTPLRRALQNVCVANADLAGFSLPKGLSAILPILLQGLLYGNAEQKEEAASGLGDVIQRTNAASLRVFVTQITGPLIRIVGERSGAEVKSAILASLSLLLEKIPAALKPFLPQLQRSFTKSLADPSENVRTKAAAALGRLISLQTARVDPLISELILGSQNPDRGTSSAMLSALFEVVGKAGTVMSSVSKTNIISLVRDMALSDDAATSSKAAELLGVLFRTLDDDNQARVLLIDAVLVQPPTPFSVVSINGLLLNSADKISLVGAANEVAQYLVLANLSTTSFIAEKSIIATGKFLLNPELSNQFTSNQDLILSLTKCIQTVPSNSSDTQRLSLIVLQAIAKRKHEIIKPHIDAMGGVIFGCVRSMVLPVKLAAEAAFVHVFQMTTQGDALLQPFLERQDPAKARSIGEYAKRVASKVATAENERHAAGIVSRDDDISEILGTEDEGTFE